jgi:hypothetical protein
LKITTKTNKEENNNLFTNPLCRIKTWYPKHKAGTTKNETDVIKMKTLASFVKNPSKKNAMKNANNVQNNFESFITFRFTK